MFSRKYLEKSVSYERESNRLRRHIGALSKDVKIVGLSCPCVRGGGAKFAIFNENLKNGRLVSSRQAESREGYDTVNLFDNTLAKAKYDGAKSVSLSCVIWQIGGPK